MWQRLFLVMVFALFTTGLIDQQAIAAPQTLKPERALERLFTAPKPKATWFTPHFLSQVPLTQMSGLIASLKTRHGQYQSVKQAGPNYLVFLERAHIPTRIRLDADGKISGLLFTGPIAAGKLADHVKAIAELPGRSSLLILQDGKEIAAHNADTEMAVASTAKLAVLKAVSDAINEGKLAWNQVVTLDPAWRSLPTGALQGWPAGSPVTIATLANLMISVSDNTATDALIHLAGRERVEAITPRNTPFLTTRELFTLKSARRGSQRAMWQSATLAQKRDMMRKLATIPLPSADELAIEPTIEIGWSLSVRASCSLISELAEQPSLAINKGMSDPKAWTHVAYKGGSDIGVLNFTTLMRNKAGTRYCVSATWNNPKAALDSQVLTQRYRAILDSLVAAL